MSRRVTTRSSKCKQPTGYLLDETPQTKSVAAGGVTVWTFVNEAEGDETEGRWVAIYKLNCDEDPGLILWDSMPNNLPAGCDLAEGVGFDIINPGNPGVVVEHHVTGSNGRIIFFVPTEWGGVTVVETDNPTPVEDDSVRIDFDVPFTCTCQYPTSGAVNIVTPQSPDE